MKILSTILTTLLVSILAFRTHSQTFEFEKSSVDTTVKFKADEQYELLAGIKNLSNTTVTIAYKVKKNKVPTGWRYSLCDPQKCNVPETAASDSGQAVLAAGSTTGQLFRVTVYPTTEDNFDVEYEVYDVANPSIRKVASFSFSNEPTNTVSIGNSSITFSGVGNKQSISINSTANWTLLGVPTWVEVNSLTGFGRGILTFTTKEASNEIAVITINGSNPIKTIQLRQSNTTSLEIFSDLSMKFYPNPAFQSQDITLSTAQDFDLFDSIGNRLFSGIKSSKIYTTGLLPGFYLVVIKQKAYKIIIR